MTVATVENRAATERALIRALRLPKWSPSIPQVTDPPANAKSVMETVDLYV